MAKRSANPIADAFGECFHAVCFQPVLDSLQDVGTQFMENMGGGSTGRKPKQPVYALGGGGGGAGGA